MVWFDLSRSEEIVKHEMILGYSAEAPDPSTPVLIDIVEVIPVAEPHIEQSQMSVDNNDQ